MPIHNDSKKLGKGLGVLFSQPVNQPENESNISDVDINEIETNPFQPRKIFSEENLIELAASINSQGLIQPIVLRKVENKYQIISGERRWRAFKKLNKNSIPSHIIDSVSDEDMLEMAIIENIQREDLSPLEIAESYKQLMDECSLTQEQVAERLGKKRSSIANYLRLNNLPEIIKNALNEKKISHGHAKIILSMNNEEMMTALFQLIINRDLTVRKTEEEAKRMLQGKKKKNTEQLPAIDQVFLTEQERKLSQIINGRDVRIKVNKGEKGAINIKFNTVAELDAIMKLLKA